jgi:hypothetical protein
MSRGLLVAFSFLLVFFALPALSAETADGHSGAVNFPGDGVNKVVSPSGMTVYYVDPGDNADGIDERPIRLRYPNGRIEQIDTFTRNADVSWSPRGDYLVITNWIGSNVADCSVITPLPSGARKQSLTSIIAGDHLQAASRDIREGDHVYVSCGDWISPSRVEVRVNGYGFPAHCTFRPTAPCTPEPFDDILLYDGRSGRLSISPPAGAK